MPCDDLLMISFIPTRTTSLVGARFKYGFRKCFMSSIISWSCGSTDNPSCNWILSSFWEFYPLVRVANSFVIILPNFVIQFEIIVIVVKISLPLCSSNVTSYCLLYNESYNLLQVLIASSNNFDFKVDSSVSRSKLLALLLSSLLPNMFYVYNSISLFLFPFFFFNSSSFSKDFVFFNIIINIIFLIFLLAAFELFFYEK